MSMEQSITYVGLDVHKSGINVAVLLPFSTEPDAEWQLANQPRAIKRLAAKLKKMAPGVVASCYEAGPCGYAVQRRLTGLGIECAVIAPSLIPVKPGERVKTDRRDAKKLAELFRAGLLTEVHAPTPAQEAVRDLTRAREDAKQDLMRARHRLSKMLLRHGLAYSEGRSWTLKHKRWLEMQRFEEASAQRVFDNYRFAVEQAEERVEELKGEIERVASSEPYAERVGWLRCLRGIDTVTAMTLLAELPGFARFRTPRDLMSYLGLTPSEHSSSTRQKRGSITKTGNGHVRRILVEAAWHYRHRPRVSAYMRKRRKGQPEAVLAIADKAQSRLHRRYRHLKTIRGKHHNVVTVAIARELVGFIWAILTHHERKQSVPA